MHRIFLLLFILNTVLLTADQSVYISIDRLQSEQQIRNMRFADFDYLYIFHPNTQTISDVTGKPISYKQEQKNEALTLLLLTKSRGITKRLLSIGHMAELMPVLIKNPKKLTLYIKTISSTLKKYDYDGVEIDWEQTINIKDHLKLMTLLRSELNKISKNNQRKYILTTAMHSYLATRYDKKSATNLSQQVDFLNIMTYDFGGGNWGKKASHNTPLPAIKKYMAKWRQHFSAHKLHMGMANYGYLYMNLKPNTANREAVRRGRSITWQTMQKLILQGWQEKWDKRQTAALYFSPDGKSFASFDTQQSIERKIDYAQQEGFKLFWWEFHCDYNSKNNSNPMLDSASKYIKSKN